MQDLPIIPLEVLLGNPVYSSAKVSPDGQYISYLKPSTDKDVLNVWVRERSSVAGGAADRMVTNDSRRGVRLYAWAEDSRHILYLQDKDGDEDWHLYAAALDGSSPARDLTPFKGVRAENLLTDPHHPDTVLLGLNKRDPRVFDMYRLNISTGELTVDTANPGDVISWHADYNFIIRGALSMNPADGSKTLRVRQAPGSDWCNLITWPQEEEGSMVCFTKDGRSLYVKSSLGQDTTELQMVAADQATAAAPASAADAEAAAASTTPPTAATVLERLGSSPKCDVGQVVVDWQEHVPQAVGFNYLRQEWKVLDAALQADFDLLTHFKGADADLSIESRSTDNSVWLLSYVRDDAPTEYYVYDRSVGSTPSADRIHFLFANRPELSRYKLGRRHPVLLTARDGITLPSYLTLPPLAKSPKTLLPENPSSWDQAVSALQLPLVLFVHGGPWARDSWGLDSTAQWFCNRGYAVLQVNYRASSGFGKRFLHLGDGQWGVGTMQHDLTDAVQWAVRSGIADPQHIAIYGGSYGGYACLAGLAFTPELYCCGVDIVGPSHVRTLLQSVPAYWAPFKKQLIDRIGDAEGNDDLNQKISPLYHAAAMRAPLIIAQGANDPRVKKAESDQIYQALKGKGLEVQYFLYEDEGHGFARPPNRLDFCSRVDQFLAKHLQGRAEVPLNMQDTSIVAMHDLKSLEDYKPPSGGKDGKTVQQQGAKKAGLAAAVTAAAAAVAGVGARAAQKSQGNLGKKIGLAIGVPACVLAGGAAVVVAVLRGLSPRR